MINSNRFKCTGCAACEQICPRNCISMVEDHEGFLYPKVDENRCISCSACEKVCQIGKNKTLFSMKKAIAFQNSQWSELKKSTSGGAAYCISKSFIDDHGFVFASRMMEKNQIAHTCISTIEGLMASQGSKYVQSDIRKVFAEIKDCLSMQKKKVLFIGTPCQGQGLRLFLNKDFENLYIIDLICHGVPSLGLYKKYIESLEKKGNVANYSFRDKEISAWGDDYRGSYFLNGKRRVCDSYLDPYYYAFMSCKSLRESCYTCEFATDKRVGDLTIGDWWTGDRSNQAFDYPKGVSVCIANTGKGEYLLKVLRNYGTVLDITIEKAKEGQRNFVEPVKRPDARSVFYIGYERDDFMSDCKVPFRNYVKAMIPKTLRNKLKRD